MTGGLERGPPPENRKRRPGQGSGAPENGTNAERYSGSKRPKQDRPSPAALRAATRLFAPGRWGRR